MILNNNFFTYTLATVVLSTSLITMPVPASETGAFVGGMIASKVLTNMRQRTRAEQTQAYYAQQNAQQQQFQQMQQPVSAAPVAASLTQEQKLAQLDKLAVGGYITPDEYKVRKTAIIEGR